MHIDLTHTYEHVPWVNMSLFNKLGAMMTLDIDRAQFIHKPRCKMQDNAAQHTGGMCRALVFEVLSKLTKPAQMPALL